MKTKMLFACIGLFILVDVYSQTSRCPNLKIKMNDSVFCWNGRFVLSTNNDSANRTLSFWRLDSNTTDWKRVNSASFAVNGSCDNPVNQLGTLPPSTLSSLFSTLPNNKPAIFDFILSTNSNNLVTNTPFNNNACFSDTIRHLRINPIPLVTLHPDTLNRNYCKNSIVSDTLQVSALGPDSIININLTFQWYAASSRTSTGFLVSGATNRFFVPPTVYSFTGGTKNYYYCVVKNSFGCSVRSNASGAITVYDTIRTTTNKSTCYNIPYIRNVGVSNSGDTLRDTLRNAGTYIKHLTSVVTGCDSAAKLILTLTYNPTKTITVSRCTGVRYYWDKKDKSYDPPSRDTAYKTNASGCDSMFVLNLLQLKTSKDTIRVNFCDTNKNTGYYFDGKLFKKDTIYKATYTNSVGCDSSRTLILKYTAEATTQSVSTSICDGDTIVINNKKYFAAIANKKDTIRNQNGCDSIRYNITIAIKQKTSSVLYDSICPSLLPLTWNGLTINSTGVYSKLFKYGNAIGCDSTAYLHLFVKQNSHTVIIDTICQQPGRWDGYLFIDTLIKTSGTYIKHTLNAAGCDSMIELRLYIKATSITNINAYICQNCSYPFFGQTLTTTGTYEEHILNSVGCDSLVRLSLFVGQISGDTIICKTDTALFYVKNSETGLVYNWGVSNGGTLYGNNPADTIRALFDSTHHTYVTLTAIDTTNGGNITLYQDTFYINVGVPHMPKLATTGGVGCQLFKDSIFNNELQIWTYIIDTTINANGCTNVCANNVATYFLRNRTNTSTYNWIVSGGIKLTTGTDTMMQVLWGNVGTGEITITETTALGCRGTVKYCFNIIPSPTARIVANGYNSDTIEVCKGTSVSFSGTASTQQGSSTIAAYGWNFGDNTTSVGATTTHVYSGSGFYTAILTVANSCHCDGRDTVVIRVHDSTGVNIVCNKVVCDSTTAYYSLDISSNANCTPAQMDSGWSVIGGHIVHYYGNAILVMWDSIGNGDTAYVKFDNSVCANLCPAKSVIKIPILKKNKMIIQGDSVICSGVATMYSLPTSISGTTYTWSATNATITHTNQPNIVWVTATSATATLHCDYYNSLAQCGGDADMTITVAPKNSISGSTRACLGDSVLYTINGTSNSGWYWHITKPDATTDSIVSDTLRYIPTLTGIYTITAIGSSLCGTNNFNLTVFERPQAPDTIKGIDSVCSTETYAYSIAHPQAGNTYQWIVKTKNPTTNGASFVGLNTGSTVHIKYNSNNPNFSADVKVFATNSNDCTSDTTTLHITKFIPQNAIIATKDTVCPDTKIVYEASYKDADAYEWSISPADVGSIASGDGTASIEILWNHIYAGSTATVKLNYRKCGQRYSATPKLVSIIAAPVLTLTFDTTICLNSAFTAQLTSSPVGTMGTVLWSFGDGTNKTTTGNTATHTYTAPITANTPYAISASVNDLAYGGCNYTVPILVRQDYNNGNVIVMPTPKVTISPIGYYLIPTGGSANLPLTASINAAYGGADTLKWVMPTGNTSCTTPFSCTTQTATIVGSYYAIASNSNGCSSKSDSTIVAESTPGGGCDFADFTINGDTIAPCGHTNLSVTWNNVTTHSNSWNIGGKVVSNSDNFDYTYATKGIYRIWYYGSAGDSANCWLAERVIQQTVPLVPTIKHTVKCNATTTEYDVIIGDYSGFIDGTTNVQYDFYIDGSSMQNSNAYEYTIGNLALGSNHTAYIRVTYTYGGITYTCNSDTVSFAIPTIPEANYTISPKHCEGITMQFTATSAYNSANSYFWKFGDGSQIIVYNPQKVYSFALSPTPLTSLTVSNGLGCVVVSNKSLAIARNRLGGSITDDNYYICPNSIQNINFNNGLGNLLPTTYVWFNSRGQQIRQYLDSGSIFNPYTVNKTGSYWVRVEDNNGCYANILGNAVVIIAPISKPTISSNPALETGMDTLSVCVNNAFSLTANGNNIINYQWFDEGGTQIAGGGGTIDKTISFAANSLSVGLHSFTVKTTVDIGNGNSCDTVSSPFYVRINAAPATPAINISNVDCSSYTISLTATSSTTGTFVWSNGDISINANSSTTTVNKGGKYRVVLDAGIDCTSEATFDVKDNPQEYLNSLAQGCYNICIPDSGLIIPMIQSTPFTQWQWLMNVNAGYQLFTQGSGVVPPLTIYNSGDYLLVVNNGLCSDTAREPISINQPDTCDVKEQNCNFVVTDLGSGWNNGCDTVTLKYDIINNNNQSVAYTVTTNTGLTVAGGVVTKGINNITAICPNNGGVSGSMVLTFTFYITVGNTTLQCTEDLNINIDQCRPVKTSSSNKVDISEQSYLLLYPSATNNITRVQYQYPTASAINAQRNIVLRSVWSGEVKAQYKVAQKGLLTIDVSQLPKGLYLMQLMDNGKIVQTKKLLIVR